jgi:hypothetical protein
MIPGGTDNEAAGTFSFAAGRRAKALHSGVFVWADQTDADFSSTASDQFLIRASGGVGVGTASPNGALHIQNTMSIANSTNYDDRVAPLVVGDGDGVDACLLIDGNQIEVAAGDKLNLNTTSPEDVVIAVGGGDVGIGRTPTTNKLEVEGDASKTVAGSWLANSDKRIKTDVQALSDALAMIDQLRPVQFKYTDNYRAKHPAVKDRTYVNFIAQEYREVFPDDVKDSGEDHLLQVDTYAANIYAVAAIQELHKNSKSKTEQIKALQTELAAVKTRLVELQTLIRTLTENEREK